MRKNFIKVLLLLIGIFIINIFFINGVFADTVKSYPIKKYEEIVKEENDFYGSGMEGSYRNVAKIEINGKDASYNTFCLDAGKSYPADKPMVEGSTIDRDDFWGVFESSWNTKISEAPDHLKEKYKEEKQNVKEQVIDPVFISISRFNSGLDDKDLDIFIKQLLFWRYMKVIRDTNLIGTTDVAEEATDSLYVGYARKMIRDLMQYNNRQII